jgi:peptidyl-dipeptidase Dcp
MAKMFLAETNNYQLHITNEEDLKGLPDGAREMATSLANQNMEGWFYLIFQVTGLCDIC